MRLEEKSKEKQKKLKEVKKVAPILTEMHALKEELRTIFETSKD